MLVIEDDQSICCFITASVRRKSWRTKCVKRLKAALKQDLSRYCTVWVDLRLPDGKGWDFIRECIQKERFRGHLIICSAYLNDDMGVIREITKLSAEWFSSVTILSKPFAYQDVDQVLMNVCQPCPLMTEEELQ